MISDPAEEIVPVPEKVKIDKVAIACCFFNPAGYSRNLRNYVRFRNHMAQFNVDVFVVELVFNDDRPELKDPDLLIRGTDDNLLWQKERILNLLIKQIPDEYDAIGWFDADILFLNQRWLTIAKEKLQKVSVIQPFQDCHHLMPDSTLEFIKPSVAYGFVKDLDNCTNLAKYHPGFAWIARADIVRKGLMESGVTGGADSLMVRSFTRKKLGLEDHFPSIWVKECNEYAKLIGQDACGSLDYVPGSILHLYHGSRKNRLYMQRWQWLMDANFDPYVDTEIDQSNGLLKWSDHARKTKPELISNMTKYFHNRKEDE